VFDWLKRVGITEPTLLSNPGKMIYICINNKITPIRYDLKI